MSRTGFESYLSSSTNQYIRDGNAWFSRVEDGVLRFSSHSAGLGREIAQLRGDSATAQKLGAIASGMDAGRAMVGSTRFIFPVHNLVTGQMFWQTNNEGWARDQNGQYITRDWMDIAMDILALFARLITPIRLLHHFKVYDLGHHASRGLSGASMGLWGSVLAINMVQVTRDLVTETDTQVIHKRAWDGIQSGIDFIALPFDFGLGANHPALAITGAVLNIASAGSMLAKDILCYG